MLLFRVGASSAGQDLVDMVWSCSFVSVPLFCSMTVMSFSERRRRRYVLFVTHHKSDGPVTGDEEVSRVREGKARGTTTCCDKDKRE